MHQVHLHRHPSLLELFLFTLLFLLLAIAVLFVFVPSAHAATTWTVSVGSTGACTTADPRCATVAAAIKAATRLDTIKIEAGTFVENLTVEKSLTFIGAGAHLTILDGGYPNADRCVGTPPIKKSVLYVPSGVIASFSDMTVQHGCIIGTGDPILEGGGLDNRGHTTMTRVIVQENTVRGPLGGGGGISNETMTGVLYLTDVIIANNVAEEAAGLDNDRFATLTNVAVFGNQAIGTRRDEGLGGGIENDTLPGAVITLTNVVVFGNTAVVGGGGIANDERSTMILKNVTVANNSAPKAGGILNWNAATVENVLVANNSGGNCDGNLTAAGQNLSTDGSCGAGFMTRANAGLAAALADNGGFIPTLALLPGSPAIDAVANCGQLRTDARGLPRPVDGDNNGTAACDIGAYEFGARAADTPTAASSAPNLSTNTPASAPILPTAVPPPVSIPSQQQQDNLLLLLGGGAAGLLIVGVLLRLVQGRK